MTYSDFITLLLTFFVLLISMSSMDRSVLPKVSVNQASKPILPMGEPYAAESRAKKLVEFLRNPWDIQKRPEKFLELLFQEPMVAPAMQNNEFFKDLSITLSPEGVALVLSESSLFFNGADVIRPEARNTLVSLVDLVVAAGVDVNISGHTEAADSKKAHDLETKYERSASQALSVLSFFMDRGAPRSRFSVSGYGPDRPLANGSEQDGLQRDRRVEILLKVHAQDVSSTSSRLKE